MKKLLSLLLITALLLTVLPTAVLAGEITADAPVATLEPEESEVTEPIPGTCITEEELEDVLVGLFGAMEAEEFDVSGNANRAVNYAYTQRTASQDLIEFIMVHENSIQDSYKPMWDVSQWSIGFGSRCPSSPSFYKNPNNYAVSDFPGATEEEKQENMDKFLEYCENGMPLAEAEALLEDMVNESFAPAVNNIAQKYNITLTQSQFDALVDFSYALGAGWTSGCRLRTGLVENYHGQTWTTANSLCNPGWFFINGVGTWCHVSGSADHGAATRRVQELEMFQYGDYYGNYRYDQVPNGEIHYTYLLFNGNGGTLVQPTETDWTTSNRFYFTGSPYGNLMNATRSGYYFAGWYTDQEGGTKITADTIAEANHGSYAGITVYAHWSKDPVDPQIGTPVHTYAHEVTLPTCNNPGYTTYTCNNCGNASTGSEVAALGHDEISHAAKAPTCTEKGWDAYVTCSRCDYSTYKEIGSTGHDHKATVTKPTCTDKGYTTYTCACGDTYTDDEVAALGHDEIDHAAKAPTCTEKGWDAYVTCSRCDYSTYQELGATGHDHKATVTKPTCTDKGYTTYTCSCGDTYTDDEIPALDHDWDEGMITTPPTATSHGFKTFSCQREGCVETKTISIPATGPTVTFTDVNPNAFYAKPVNWAVENGITSGTSSTTFSPDASCTRGQVVTFLWRAAGCPAPTSTDCPFTDVSTKGFYYKAMLWAVENGITSGTSSTTFAPDAPCTRGQVVTFLWRAAGKPSYSDNTCNFTDVSTKGFYYKAMLWAVENDVTSGTSKTTFAPDAPCTRGQVVTFLYRAYN